MTERAHRLRGSLLDVLTFPVLLKEMRSRMRTFRTPALILVATLILGIVVATTLYFAVFSSTYGGGIADYRRLAEAGHTTIIVLISVLAVIVTLIVPSVTAGTISLEREHQTFDFLLLTRLSPANIVFGKLLSSLSVVVLVVVCAVPLAGICFLIGGVSPGELLWSLAIILSAALLFGAVGMWASARARKTATAGALAYGIALFWTAGIPFLVGILSSVYYSSSPLDWWMETLPRLAGLLAIGAAAIAFFAAVPAYLIGDAISLLIRRPLPGWLRLMLWGGFAAALTFSLLDLTWLSSMRSEMFLYGNPAVALAVVLSGDNFVLDAVSSAPIVITFLATHVVAVTVLWHVVAGLFFIGRAVDEVGRRRHA